MFEPVFPRHAPRQRDRFRAVRVPVTAGTIALALLTGAGALAGCGGKAHGTRATRLHYTITVPENAGGGAEVVVTVDGTAPRGMRLLLPPQGNRRQLVAFAPDPARPDDPPAIRYSVAAPASPHGGQGFACYRGFELLAQSAGVQPEGADSVVLEFVLAGEGQVVAPLAAIARDVEAPRRGPLVVTGEEFKTLLSSYVAVGDYTLRVLPPIENKLPAIVWGRRALGVTSESELMELVEMLLVKHAEAFGPDRVDVPYSVVIDAPYTGHGFAGNATGRSIDLRLSKDLGPNESPGLVRLTSHELSHFWLGGAFSFPQSEDHWFVEGAADYYGLRARVAAGYTDEAAAGDELASMWYELAANRWLHEPMEDLGHDFAGDPEAFTASYQRGCVTTWALDWRARAAGRPSVAQALRARGSNRETMKVYLSKHLGGDAAADVGPLLGESPEPTMARVLGDAAGLTYHAVPTEELTFGLERFEPGTTRLMSVPAGTPARESGLRPGDRIRAVDGLQVFDTVQLQHAIENAYARPGYKLEGMEFTYERSGTFESVRLFAAPQLAPHWIDATGHAAAHVLP
jgi:predicted metalloprotease with PDZ domain